MGQYFQVLADIRTLKVFKKHINNSTKICEKQKLVMNHQKYQRNRQQLKRPSPTMYTQQEAAIWIIHISRDIGQALGGATFPHVRQTKKDREGGKRTFNCQASSRDANAVLEEFSFFCCLSPLYISQKCCIYNAVQRQEFLAITPKGKEENAPLKYSFRGKSKNKRIKRA